MRSCDMSPCRRWLLLLLLSFFVLSLAEAAQQTQASIIGQVKDESGSVLPGLTVTATSPSLQVPSVVVVTNELGEYRLAPLPIGTYELVYELQGFQTLRREGLRLTAGFVAREDVVLKVGGLEESITVSGASPLVDATSTTTATHLTRETLEVLPGSRNSLIGLMAQAPGVRTNLDVGGDTTGARPWNRLFGQPGEPWYKLDGVVTTSLTLDGGAANYWNYNTFEEARIQTLGADAEAPTRGLQINAIVKSGGNDFSGGASGRLTNHHLQGDNIDEGLAAQGITSGNPLITRSDVSGDLGGRIIRNKLWFYGAARRREQQAEVLGKLQPDGSPAFQTQVEWLHTEKLSYQLSSSNRLSGFFQYNQKYNTTPGPAYIAWETRGIQWSYTRASKVEWQVVRGNSMVFSLLWGRWSQHGDPRGITGNVGTRDVATLAETGERASLGQRSVNRRQQFSANLTWYRPDWFHGNHEFKVGADYMANSHARPHVPREKYNYRLLFNNGVPFQIQAFNFPNKPWAATNYFGVYARDNWTIRRRLTLNLGVRYAHDDGFVPAACTDGADPPGHLAFPAACYPKGQLRIYQSVVPRVHATYDLTGNGATVLKGGWARFARMRHLDPDVVKLDPMVPNHAFYRWRDLNGNRLYDPGEVNLDPNGPDYVSRASQVNAVPNPDEKQPISDELSISLERALTPSFSVRVTGVHSRSTSWRLQNNLRPYQAYNVPVTRPDPGPDGRVGTADDPGTFVTYYEFAPALAGLRFEEFMAIDDPAADRTYKSFELATFRRLASGWQFAASYSASKKDIPFHDGLVPGGFLPEVQAGAFNPNAEINQADRTWEWQSKVSGAYVFPADVLVSANFEHRSGTAFARQVLFTGGQTIPSIVLNAEPLGTRRLPNINLLDLRGEKRFALTRGQKLAVQVNLYNALNANTVTALIMRAGASFLRPTSIMSPRILEFGMSYTF